jgi:DNA invertase Pin-like site-specific DNA recombinase
VTYIRLASKKPNDHHATRQQRDACRHFASRHGIAICREFTDCGISGTRLHRAAMQRLLDYVQAHPIDYVLCTDVSRVARDYDVFCELVRQLEARGAHLMLAGSGAGGTGTATP